MVRPHIHRRAFIAGGVSMVVAPSSHAQQLASSIISNGTGSLDANMDASGRPTARVYVNGEGPFRFRVDTGANSTAIDRRIAALLDVPITGQAIVHGTTGQAVLPIARIARLKAGFAEQQDFSAPVLETGFLHGVDGIIGGDVFRGKRLIFDMKARTVELERSVRGVRLSNEQNLRLFNKTLAHIDGWVGDVKTRMILDTGADCCLINAALSRILERSPKSRAEIHTGTVTGVTGQNISGDLVELPMVKFSTFTLSGQYALVADIPIFSTWELHDTPAMLIGADVFSQLSRFVIDYGARTFDADLAAWKPQSQPGALMA